MTTDVVTVDRITTHKEIAQLLAKHKISAVPVLIMGRHVAGVVSEADLLAAHDQAARRASNGRTGLLPWKRQAVNRRHDHSPSSCWCRCGAASGVASIFRSTGIAREGTHVPPPSPASRA